MTLFLKKLWKFFAFLFHLNEECDTTEKIYNEIKNSSYNEKNIHILEDRGIIDEKDGDFDEEIDIFFI